MVKSDQPQPQPQRRRAPRKRKLESKAWVGNYKGRTIELYGRSALAEALHRSVSTIREMERRGILRTYEGNPSAMRDHRGRWCYTKEQIFDLAALADREGVLDPKYHRPFTVRFVNEAKEILSRHP